MKHANPLEPPSDRPERIERAWAGDRGAEVCMKGDPFAAERKKHLAGDRQRMGSANRASSEEDAKILCPLLSSDHSH